MNRIELNSAERSGKRDLWTSNIKHCARGTTIPCSIVDDDELKSERRNTFGNLRKEVK